MTERHNPGGFDRGAKTDLRQRRAIQELQAAYERGGLINLDPSGGLVYLGTDPAELTIVTLSPITVSMAGVGLALADPSGLEVDAEALRIRVDAPITRSAAGVGISLAAGLAESGGDLDYDLPALPAFASPASFDAADLLLVYDAGNADHRRLPMSDLARRERTGTLRMTLQAAAESGWLLLNGDTIGNTGSGADHEGAGLEALYLLVRDLPPNAGTEVFASGDQVTLPDMARRVPMGAGGTAVSGPANTLGAVGGVEAHALTLDEIPAHDHDYVQYETVTRDAGAEDTLGPATTMTPLTTTAAGGGMAHTNVQPSLVVNFEIRI